MGVMAIKQTRSRCQTKIEQNTQFVLQLSLTSTRWSYEKCVQYNYSSILSAPRRW